MASVMIGLVMPDPSSPLGAHRVSHLGLGVCGDDSLPARFALFAGAGAVVEISGAQPVQPPAYGMASQLLVGRTRVGERRI